MGIAEKHDANEQKNALIAVGTMSGTSADGVDVALVRTNGQNEFQFLGATTQAYPEELRARLLQAAIDDVSLVEVLDLEEQLTEQHARVCLELLSQLNVEVQDVDVIGFHGHTIRHLPERAMTWQLGNASLLAYRTGVTVVHDFRRADMAAGGEGAPLAPLFHQMLLQDRIVGEGIAVLNLGGVANITWLSQDGTICAGDTGPGCGLLDMWSQEHIGEDFDKDGELAGSGNVINEVVQLALKDSFFDRVLPKSADRHQFVFAELDQLTPADGAATLCAITAQGVAKAFQQLRVRPSCVYVCGGGAKHPVLMDLLRKEFEEVRPISQIGLRVDSMEAECFAWLAVRSLRGLPTSAKETTGCERPVVGGSITKSPRR